MGGGAIGHVPREASTLYEMAYRHTLKFASGVLQRFPEVSDYPL